MPTAPLSFHDCFTGRPVSLVLVADGKLLSPAQLRAQIMHPLEFIKCQKCFFSHHRWEQALPPLGCVVAECSPCGRVSLMLRCVAFACQRLATAPADMHMAHMSWSWAEVVMDRVTRGRVKKVQETVAGFEAAAARVAGGPDILESAENGAGASVVCHLIADADSANKRDRYQWTPLHFSARYGRLEVCRLLLQCNADIEAKDSSQRTPLNTSARYGRLEVCHLLVESKADVAARDRCFSPPPSHHLSLTICLAAMAKLHSNGPSTKTKTTLLHTCAASARRNDALPRPACCARAPAKINFVYKRQDPSTKSRFLAQDIQTFTPCTRTIPTSSWSAGHVTVQLASDALQNELYLRCLRAPPALGRLAFLLLLDPPLVFARFWFLQMSSF
jgi:hypothetical protein